MGEADLPQEEEEYMPGGEQTSEERGRQAEAKKQQKDEGEALHPGARTVIDSGTVQEIRSARQDRRLANRRKEIESEKEDSSRRAVELEPSPKEWQPCL